MEEIVWAKMVVVFIPLSFILAVGGAQDVGGIN
jgi:hypothetical protein